MCAPLALTTACAFWPGRHQPHKLRVTSVIGRVSPQCEPTLAVTAHDRLLCV